MDELKAATPVFAILTRNPQSTDKFLLRVVDEQMNITVAEIKPKTDVDPVALQSYLTKTLHCRVKLNV